MRRILSAMALAAAAAWASWSAAQVVDLDQPKSRTKEQPDVWAKAPEAEARKAEEAARKDACVQLVEAAYRLSVAANRDVLDMMMRNPQVDRDLIQGLAGAAPVNAVYVEDGSVRVIVTTTPAEVEAILKKAYAKVDWDRAEEDSTIAAVSSRTKKDVVIAATGEGALAGSEGEKRIPVRRAALAKAEEEIAKQVLDMVLRDDYRQHDHVQDFCLVIREAQKKLALGLSATRIYGEEWAPDGSVSLRAEVNAKDITSLLILAQNLYDGLGKFRDWGWSVLRTSTEDMILQGAGRARPGEAPPDNTPLNLESRALDAAMRGAPKK